MKSNYTIVCNCIFDFNIIVCSHFCIHDHKKEIAYKKITELRVFCCNKLQDVDNRIQNKHSPGVYSTEGEY